MLIERLGRIKLREEHSRYIPKPLGMYIARQTRLIYPAAGGVIMLDIWKESAPGR
jgi:hypothetical protein